MYILYFIYIISIITTVYGLYFLKQKYDNHYLVLKKFDKDITLYKLIVTCITTFISFIKMLITVRVQNYINGFCINKVNKNIYDVQFIIQNKKIKFRIKIYRGPSKVLQILNTENNNDITTDIDSFFNYEMIPITVNNQNLKDIDVYLSNGEVLNFSNDDYIKLN
tara:strand:+ start:40 stop:534 length:495 start_codon:yes stop_codon:yes gene_type:complete